MANVLVVDLDGTLIRTDLLHETASSVIVASPWRAFSLLGLAGAGRAQLKHHLTERVTFDPATLPYNDDVLAWLAEEKAAGHTIVLASASDQMLVDSVAAHVGLFDAAHGSDGTSNLRSEAKRALLDKTYGAGNWEYVGNSEHDLPVWKAAVVAHVVTRDPKLLLAVDALGVTRGRVFTPQGRPPLRAVLKAMRLHQWSKNALIFVPLLLAHMLKDGSAIGHSVLAFASFSLAASSVYVLNDLSDVTNDRHHPTKRRRPFASGDLSLLTGWVLWPVLAVIGLLLCLFLPLQFFGVLLGYLVLTLAYTFWLKKKAAIDVVVLGLLYTVRVLAGAAAVNSGISMWLLTFSLFLFLGLALTKRVSELTNVRRELAKEAKGRGYRETDLELLSMVGVASSLCAVLLFTMYVDDPATVLLYKTPDLLWAAAPVLLAWLLRVWLTAHRGDLDEDPIVFALKDRPSMVAGALVVVIFVVAATVTWNW